MSDHDGYLFVLLNDNDWSLRFLQWMFKLQKRNGMMANNHLDMYPFYIKI